MTLPVDFCEAGYAADFVFERPVVLRHPTRLRIATQGLAILPEAGDQLVDASMYADGTSDTTRARKRWTGRRLHSTTSCENATVCERQMATVTSVTRWMSLCAGRGLPPVAAPLSISAFLDDVQLHQPGKVLQAVHMVAV